MSYTWTQFKDAVLAAFNPSAQGVAREEAAIEAVALLVKSQIAREVDGDLERRKSYLDSYRDAKLKLAGYTITSNFATVKAGVVTRLTVDGARAPLSDSSGYNDKNIQQAIDDFNGTATMFDQLLTTAAVEIQRHARGYTLGHRNEYKYDNTGVYHDGMVSRVTLPAGCRVAQVFFGTTYDDLAPNTPYIEDDVVVSNGRLYICTEPGTSADPLGDGLTTTDGIEYSGTALFRFYGPRNFGEAAPIPWSCRQSIYQAHAHTPAHVGPRYALSPRGDELWFFPALREELSLILDWDGIKTSFSGSDATAFDQPCAQYAAQFVRGMLQKDLLADERAAAASLSAAAAMLKRLWLDSTAKS